MPSSPTLRNPEIALIGTSYSANPLWSFEAQLKAALGRDVLNFSEAGPWPDGADGDFPREAQNAARSRAKAVIWEIPLRYLDDDPKTAPGASPV